MMTEPVKIERNPFIPIGKQIDVEVEIYAKLGTTKAQDWQKFEKYIAENKHHLHPPILGDEPDAPHQYHAVDHFIKPTPLEIKPVITYKLKVKKVTKKRKK